MEIEIVKHIIVKRILEKGYKIMRDWFLLSDGNVSCQCLQFDSLIERYKIELFFAGEQYDVRYWRECQEKDILPEAITW